MKNVQAKAQIIFRKILTVILLLIAAVILYVLFYNWTFWKYKFTPQYEVKRYGVTWRTHFGKTKQVAEEHKRQIMVVYINSGAKNAPSDRLIEHIFKTDTFKDMSRTYIPLLVEVKQGVKPAAREKGNMDEIIKQFDLGSNYGRVILAGAGGDEIRHIDIKSENAGELKNKLSDGKYVPQPAISKPKFRNPFRSKKAKKAAAKVQKAVTGEGRINPPADETDD